MLFNIRNAFNFLTLLASWVSIWASETTQAVKYKYNYSNILFVVNETGYLSVFQCILTLRIILCQSAIANAKYKVQHVTPLNAQRMNLATYNFAQISHKQQEVD